MLNKIICSFIASDRPGLIEMLADSISQAKGNWLESRSTKLAGQFAGIISIEVPESGREQLVNELLLLNERGMTVQINTQYLKDNAIDIMETSDNPLELRVIGNDRPGIVLQISQALANANLNVIDMKTLITSAAMSGDNLFSAKLTLSENNRYDLESLEMQLEKIAVRLSLEIDLEQK